MAYMRQQHLNGRRIKRRVSGFAVMVTLLVVVVLGGVVWGTVAYYHEDTHNSCHVTGKDRSYDSRQNESNTRVYTSNCGTFTVKDAFWKRNFHSSDTYASIHKGHTYDFTTIGWRVPFFSAFPNIIEVSEQ